MKKKFDQRNSRISFITFFTLLGLSAAFWVVLQIQAAQPTNEKEITVKSESVEGDYKAKVVTFIGAVEAHQDDITVHCQRLLVYYGEQPKAKSSENGAPKIDKIVAKGSVVVIRHTDNLTLTADEAVYYQNEDKIVATGNPIMKKDKDFMKATKFTMDIKTGRIFGEGPTNGSFKPNN